MEEHELALHRAFHEKALAVAPKAGREPGEFWAAVLEPDKNVSNLNSENLHWFKVKGKHTVAKVQKAFHKKCGAMVLLHQGHSMVSLTSQMQQINHFNDDIIIFSSTKAAPEDNVSDTRRTPLQSIDGATQNRMHSASETPTKFKPDPEPTPATVKAEPAVSTISPSPFKTPGISRSLPDVGKVPNPRPLGSGSTQLSIPTSEPASGYKLFADAHRENYWASKGTPAAIETALKKSWTVLMPASREFWEAKAEKDANNTSPSGNASASSHLLGFESFAEIHRGNYISSSATPAEIDSSLRNTWDKMPAQIREYYSVKDAQKSNLPISNYGPPSPERAVNIQLVPGSPSLSANSPRASMAEDQTLIDSADYHLATEGENGSPEPEPQTVELAKLRFQKLMDDSSPEVLEEEVKKTNDFLNGLKKYLQVPEAQGNHDTSHWLQQIETLQAQVVDTPTIIGVVGNTGAGKSSIINAMLDEERLVPTNCMRACTAVVTEMSWNSIDDPNKKYRAEIEFIQESDWEKDLELSLNELIDVSGNVSRDCSNAETEAGIAYAKIKAVYPNRTHEMLAKSTVEELLAEFDVRKVLGTTKTIEKSSPEFFYKELQRYVDSKEKSTKEKGKNSEKKKEKKTMEFWPLIKVVRIFVKADALSTGAVIVDLPGVHDSNAARAAVAAGYMKQCTGLWVCAPINRAVDDKAAKSLLGESFKRQLKYDGQFSRITFICSKTDDISVLEASDSLGLEDVMTEDYAKIDQIDKQVDKLNAKIAELKESMAVYNDIYHDADESLDIWDDLRRDLDAGKTVYAPKAKPENSPKRKRSSSPKTSRKKSKKSESEDDDDDDDFIDDDEDEGREVQDEVSDNETEIEEEDLDRGEPLTIEHIEQKIDELKDTKKKARKEKVAIELAIKDVKNESKGFDAERKEIDTRMRAICIDGRNNYSKTAIQQDFATGIKELDMENAEEEDAENFNPDEDIRDYDAVARSLPVFCVSSRAYQQLNGRLKKDAKIPGFRNVQETEIPQLQAHCKKLTEAGRSAACRRFLNSLLQLVLSLSLWSNNDGTNINLSDSQKAAEARWLLKNVEELEESLDKAVGKCVLEMKDALTENIYQKFSEVIPLAADQAPGIVAKWGSPVNKMDRAAGGLHFQTYKAVTRRDGVYGNRSGTYDFNSDLTEPIMKYLASHWEKNFSRRLPSVLRTFTTNANLILKKFHQAVESRSRKNGSGIAGLSMLSQQLRTYEATFSILTTEMVEAINNLQRDANREFVPVIAKNLAPSYQYCASESGAGMYMRMKDHMRASIDQKRNSMFKESCDEVKKSLDKMCRRVEESMNNKTDEVCLLMRRDYLQVLNGAQVGGEVMPKWERHMRLQVARALETYEKDEAEKVLSSVKDEEFEETGSLKEDEAMKDVKSEELGVEKGDGLTEGSTAQNDELNVGAERDDAAEELAVKTERPADTETSNDEESEKHQEVPEMESSKMDVDAPAAEFSSAILPPAEVTPTEAVFTEATSTETSGLPSA
ncbi:uncharacterized protein EAE97_005123 [Botrytis byssoidea]|uniref:Uncharacterized protein n=1 Tax=Botrytis byssoidea TaxID=139641 RepID=A0A9P5M3R9_9HELO|nr:uncharacterized protein EAE97_005123 [Botrytis byssoidea]KAF7946085.1 hypothetical protein EAE97_005123 [Botrytis byssoidea]